MSYHGKSDLRMRAGWRISFSGRFCWAGGVVYVLPIVSG